MTLCSNLYTNLGFLSHIFKFPNPLESSGKVYAALWPQWLSSFSSNTSNYSPPQGLCTRCSFCLDPSFMGSCSDFKFQLRLSLTTWPVEFPSIVSVCLSSSQPSQQSELTLLIDFFISLMSKPQRRLLEGTNYLSEFIIVPHGTCHMVGTQEIFLQRNK